MYNSLMFDTATTHHKYLKGLASFPGPAQLPSLAVRKSRRGPGIFSHLSDVRIERVVKGFDERGRG